MQAPTLAVRQELCFIGPMTALPTPRECGDCALCCHLGEVPQVKPFNQWCQHCSTHRGCDIYPTRPQICRDFFCHYLKSDLPEHWHPLTSHMVVGSYEGPPPRITVAVESEYPLIWREPSYFAQLKHWATQGAVTVMVGTTVHVITPRGSETLGELTDANQLIITEIETPQGVHYRTTLQPR